MHLDRYQLTLPVDRDAGRVTSGSQARQTLIDNSDVQHIVVTYLREEQFRRSSLASCFHRSPLSHSSLHVTSRCVTSRRRQPTTPCPSGVRWNHAVFGIVGSGQSITVDTKRRTRYTFSVNPSPPSSTS